MSLESQAQAGNHELRKAFPLLDFSPAFLRVSWFPAQALISVLSLSR
jgi:hypothetical protein